MWLHVESNFFTIFCVSQSGCMLAMSVGVQLKKGVQLHLELLWSGLVFSAACRVVVECVIYSASHCSRFARQLGRRKYKIKVLLDSSFMPNEVWRISWLACFCVKLLTEYMLHAWSWKALSDLHTEWHGFLVCCDAELMNFLCLCEPFVILNTRRQPVGRAMLLEIGFKGNAAHIYDIESSLLLEWADKLSLWQEGKHC